MCEQDQDRNPFANFDLREIELMSWKQIAACVSDLEGTERSYREGCFCRQRFA